MNLRPLHLVPLLSARALERPLSTGTGCVFYELEELTPKGLSGRTHLTPTQGVRQMIVQEQCSILGGKMKSHCAEFEEKQASMVYTSCCSNYPFCSILMFRMSKFGKVFVSTLFSSSVSEKTERSYLIALSLPLRCLSYLTCSR